MSFELIRNMSSEKGILSFPDFSLSIAKQVQEYHATIPEYAVTPLHSMQGLAEKLGIGALYVKDESYRFGLNAFKGLGGSYVVHSYCDSHPADVNPVFVTATDGNHGRGVAWAAQRMGCEAHVYMPKGTARERLDNILKLGADARILPYGYDDCVRYAADMADKNGWVLVQDTGWQGYSEIPMDIMRGYTTMGLETFMQLRRVVPTHVFLQAGVGSMAAAIAAFFCNVYGENRPEFIIVEPTLADCFYQTALHHDGVLHTATGPLESMMAGLCCGEVNPLAWDVLSRCGDVFTRISDDYAAEAMRAYAHPVGSDPKVISGESGASTLGALIALREALGLNGDARVLLISTEGATDGENYAKIVAIQ